MTRKEFGEGMVYLAAGVGKEPPEGAEMPYFDLLGHLPKDLFLQACRVVMSAHKWFTFPTVAELLEAVRDLQTPNAITAAEAWAMAREAAAQIDPDMTGPHRVYRGNGEYDEYPSQAAAVLKDLPAPVVKAIEVFGLHELCITDSPDGVIRAQFGKVFDSLQDREKRKALVPPVVKAAIERKRDEDRGRVAVALSGIGGMER